MGYACYNGIGLRLYNFTSEVHNVKEATQWNIATREEGWERLDEALGTCLHRVLEQGADHRGMPGYEVHDDKRRQLVRAAWAELAGHLLMIIYQMQQHDDEVVAEQMTEILDMVIQLDVTERKVRKAIQHRFEEYSGRKPDDGTSHKSQRRTRHATRP